MSFVERHRIRVGTLLKISTDKIKSGFDRNNNPYWKFPVALVDNGINGSDVYDYVWLKCFGKCPYKDKDWVEITKLLSYGCQKARNTAGGVTFFKTIECEFKLVDFNEVDKGEQDE